MLKENTGETHKLDTFVFYLFAIHMITKYVPIVLVSELFPFK